MTNIIKRKNLLFLMAVVVMIAMMSVACKNKVTASANLSAEAGTEEVINGTENKDAVDNKDAIYNEGTFVSGNFKATVKNGQITIEYKDAFGGQGPLVIKAEGKTPIKAQNSKVGFNFIVNGAKLLVTDATPNYDANGNLSSILFDSKYDGQKFVAKF